VSTAAILLAGGSGSRLRHSENKVFVEVAGAPLLAWSVRAFASCDAIDHLLVVAREGEHRRVARILEEHHPGVGVRLATGGATRHASELSGLDAIADPITSGAVDVVLIHDAARPFVTPELITRVVEATREVGGAVPTLELGDGVYRLTGDGTAIIHERGELHRAQTPQGFRAAQLLDAYRRSARDDFAGVDTAETVERYTDLQVVTVPGEHTNIKVTYVDDLETAARIAAQRT
jgi:2-C-methyl-D-erythritol 4-phosphate cytidylyltransferase